VTSFSAFAPGVWLHYAGVWDPSGGEARTYINGTLHQTSSTSAGPPADTGEPMHIGVDWDMACEMDGVIDELRVSAGARYGGGFSPPTVHVVDSDTMALYHFDEFNGLIAYDASGNGNHASIFGASWTTESP
jgi:hypothetical protein